jgi:hypothetical protein
MKKCIAVDFYDLIGQRESPWLPDDIDRLFAGYAEYGVTSVLWRLSCCGKLLYHSETPDRFDFTGNEYGRKTVELLQRFDPAEAAVAAARRNGIEIHFWITLYDDRGYGVNGLSSRINIEHPEYSWRSLDGLDCYAGMLSYVYPEVVEYRLRQIREINAYGGDGLYLCNRSHSRPPEIRKVMDRLCKEDIAGVNRWCRENNVRITSAIADSVGKFGFDPPALEAYGKIPQDMADWQRFRGIYFLNALRKFRDATPGKLGFGLRYGGSLDSFFIYGKDFFDWDFLAHGGLLDFMAYQLPVPPETGLEEYTDFLHPSPAEKWLWMNVGSAKPKERIDSYLKQWDSWRKHLDGVIFFEACNLTGNPVFWDFIRNLK